MNKTSFSSDDLPPGLPPQARLGLWRDLYSERFGRLDMSQPDPSHFRMRSDFMQVGSVCVSQAVGTIGRFDRPKIDMPDLFTVSIPTTPGRVESAGLDLTFRPGDIFGFDTTAAMRVRSEGCGWIGVAIPRAMFAHLPGGADALHGRLVSAGTPAAGHLRSYLDFILASGDIEEGQIEALLADHIAELAALALQAGGLPGVNGRGIRAARTHEILAAINRHYTEPDFSVARIAAKTGLSPRYIQELLSESGGSFTERLNELRLQKAHAMLANRRFDERLIAEIALACGFNEVSYFNRLFRRRFAATPGDIRRT